MDLVLSTFTQTELEQLPRFRRLLDGLKDVLDEDGRLKTQVLEVEKVEEEMKSALSTYMADVLLYRYLQSISVGNVDHDCHVPEQVRTSVGAMLATSEWNELERISPSKALNELELRKDHKLPHDFDAIVSKCVASKLESAVSMVVALSGEMDKEGLEQRIDQMEVNRKETQSLERNRCQLALAYLTALLDYLQTLSVYCDEFPFSDEQSRHESTVEWMLAKAEAMLLKANVLELQIQCAVYSKQEMERLNSIRNKQWKLCHELESDMDNLKGKLEEYKNVDGTEFTNLVKEYGKVREEIDNLIWALKEIGKDDKSPRS